MFSRLLNSPSFINSWIQFPFIFTIFIIMHQPQLNNCLIEINDSIFLSSSSLLFITIIIIIITKTITLVMIVMMIMVIRIIILTFITTVSVFGSSNGDNKCNDYYYFQYQNYYIYTSILSVIHVTIFSYAFFLFSESAFTHFLIHLPGRLFFRLLVYLSLLPFLFSHLLIFLFILVWENFPSPLYSLYLFTFSLSSSILPYSPHFPIYFFLYFPRISIYFSPILLAYLFFLYFPQLSIYFPLFSWLIYVSIFPYSRLLLFFIFLTYLFLNISP